MSLLSRFITSLFVLLAAASAARGQSYPNVTYSTVNVQNQQNMVGGAPLNLGTWTSTTRPIGPTLGAFGYNTALNLAEVWSGTSWISASSANFVGGTVPNPTEYSSTLSVAGATSLLGGGTLTGAFNAGGPLNLTGPNGTSTTPGLQLYPPLHADGVTSDDAALQTAINECSAAGGTVFLPPGKILLTGSAGTINLFNCALVGAGIPGSNTPGTEIDLTSTTVVPFTAGFNWSMSGINFYWPNQNLGTIIVYPPLIKDSSSSTFGDFYLNNVGIINAYDGIVQSNVGGSGRFYIVGGNYYAAHDLFQLSDIGDSSHISTIHMTPGPWLLRCNNTCKATVDAAATNNTMLHALSSGGGEVAITWNNSATFDWRWGIKVDSGAIVGQSDFSIDWDGMGTIVDSSAGGNYAFANTMRGNGTANCGHTYSYVQGINVSYHPCFNLGTGTALKIEGGSWSSAADTFDLADGANIYIANASLGVGPSADGGGNTYAINAAGSSQIYLSNVIVIGHPSDTGIHGIISTVAAPVRFTATGSSFQYLNEDISMIPSTTTIITSNWSIGTAGANSVIFTTSPNNVIWANNQFDKPTSPVISSSLVHGNLTFATPIGFVDFDNGTTSPPTSGTESPGMRMRLFTSGPPSYSVGIEPSNIWFAVPGRGAGGYIATSGGFKFYGGTAVVATIDNSGGLFATGRVRSSIALGVGPATIYTTAANTNTVFDVPGNIVSAVAVAGGGTGYLSTDLLTDGFGGLYGVTVNSTGVIQTLTIAVQGSTASTPPCTSTCPLAGGAGTGATANLTWTAGTTISIGPTAATAINLGNGASATTVFGSFATGNADLGRGFTYTYAGQTAVNTAFLSLWANNNIGGTYAGVGTLPAVSYFDAAGMNIAAASATVPVVSFAGVTGGAAAAAGQWESIEANLNDGTTKTNDLAAGAPGAWVAVQVARRASKNQGGTGLTPQTSFGQNWGIDVVDTALSGATNLALLNGVEINATIQAGASVLRRASLQLSSSGATNLRGAMWDNEIVSLRGTPGGALFRNGLAFGGGLSGTSPAGTDSKLITHELAQDHTATEMYGLELNDVTFTAGGGSIHVPGFYVDPNGTLNIGTTYFTAGTSGMTIDTTGSIGAGVPTISSGGSGFSTIDTTIGDDGYGGIYVFAATPTGALTTISAVVRQPIYPGLTPPATLTITPRVPSGGTGLVSIAPVWSSNRTTLSLGTGSATAINIGSNSSITTINGAIKAGAATGVLCSGTPSSSFATSNGIVVHC